MANSFISAAVRDQKVELFEKMDTNNDGVVSLAELKEHVYHLMESSAVSRMRNRGI